MSEIYAVKYTDCIYESAYYPVSLHKTKQGAVKAMIEFKKKQFSDSWIYIPHVGFKYGVYKLND